MATKREKYTQKAMITALRKSKGMVSVTARALNCSDRTMYRYIHKYPKIAEALEEERNFIIDTAEASLARAVINGEAWAVCFTLKTIGKGRGYIEKQQIEHSGSIDVSQLSDEELEQLASGQSKG